MFGYILYYIIALLIYASYQPVEKAHIPIFHTLILFFGFIVIFIAYTWFTFKRIDSKTKNLSFRLIDHQFHSALTRQSFLAIVLYAIDIYGLNIVSIVNQIKIFKLIPTLEALLFLLLFICYLAVVWSFAYAPYQKIYNIKLRKNEYVFSNISFSLPILFPWLILSATVDLINALPFDAPKRLLMTGEGQIFFFICFLILAATIGPAFIQKFWRCRPLTEGITRYRIESMCRKANMKFKDILIWPMFGGKMITAGVMGLIRQFRYILVTPALLQLLEPSEIDAVIAHEIGHVKKKHLLFYLVFFIGYLILAFSALDFLTYVFIYIESTMGFIENGGSNYTTFVSLSFSFGILIMFVIYFRYVFGFFMRNFERQADIYAFATIGTPLPLISTFEKISLSSGESPEKPNWHHFSIQERISYLIKCAADKKWIDRHNSKIKKGIIIYFLAIIILGWTGYKIHYRESKEMISTNLLIKVLLKRIQIDPGNADLYQILGDVYYSEKDYSNTINFYQKALKYNPDQIQALNNLAWLYATCGDKRFRSPKKALELAKRAASLSSESYILDTLAESYYINKNFKAAVETEKIAISKANTNQFEYKDQLKKFMKADKSQKSR